jgi:uncharacterized damage-inducible protein DinB
MNRKAKYLALLLVMAVASVRPAAAAEELDLGGMLKLHMQRMRRMIVNIVGAMPEDKYDFKATPQVRSFREMAVHLIQDGYSHVGWSAGIPREESEKLTKKYENYKTRAEILSGLNEMYDWAEKTVSTINVHNATDMVVGMRSERQTRFEAAMVAFEDQMDHYGNFVVYLRLNGVVPPSTATADMERAENQKKNKEAGIAPPAAGEEHQH